MPSARCDVDRLESRGGGPGTHSVDDDRVEHDGRRVPDLRDRGLRRQASGTAARSVGEALARSEGQQLVVHRREFGGGRDGADRSSAPPSPPPCCASRSRSSNVPTVARPSGALRRAITSASQTSSAALTIASDRYSIGVLPACADWPSIVTSYQRMPCTPVTVPSVAPGSLQDRPPARCAARCSAQSVGGRHRPAGRTARDRRSRCAPAQPPASCRPPQGLPGLHPG